MLHFELDMEPISWTPSRICRGHAYNPKSQEKKSTIQKIKDILRTQRYIIIPGYVVLDLQFIFPPLKSASKRERQLMLNRELYPTKKDCTNMQKFIEDCLKDIAFEDDRYVIDVRSRKYYADVKEGKILINVYSIEEYKEMNGT